MQRRIDELEIGKMEIANAVDDRSEKIREIKELAKQQDMIRRQDDSALLARHLGLLENSKRVLAFYPCIIDYAVDLGLRNVSEQWEASLKTTGDLNSDVNLRSALDHQISSLLCLQPSWPSSAEDPP